MTSVKASKASGTEQSESWKTAAEKIRTSMHFASSFTTAIRCLKSNDAENLRQNIDSKKLNETSRYLALRLLRAPSILAPLYYFTLTFKAKEIADKKYVSTEDLMSLYTVNELASILALVYSFHRLRRLCEAEEWERYSKSVIDAIEIGAHIGENLNELTLADGVLLNGIRYLAPAIFLKTDHKVFKNYRRDVKIKKRSFDVKMERELFHCTHIELATQFLQMLGFGVDYSEAFYRALNSSPDRAIDKPANSVRILLYWTEALFLGIKPPAINGENEVGTTDDVIDRLLVVSEQIRKSGSAFSWIAKGKSSISKKLVPQLYREGQDDLETEPKAVGRAAAKNKKGDKKETVLVEPPAYDSVPEHVREHFSEEAYDQLASEITDLAGD